LTQAQTVSLPADAVLASGAHSTLSQGACALEWVYLLDLKRAGREWDSSTRLSDHPECACPVISSFVRRWNDDLPEEARTRLLGPLVPLLLDTKSTKAVESRRAWMAVDWQVRVHTPAFLDLAGLHENAAALRSLPELTGAETARSAQPETNKARDRARAARDAANAAAWDAAMDALAPTVAYLQTSAADLVRRLCAVEG